MKHYVFNCLCEPVFWRSNLLSTGINLMLTGKTEIIEIGSLQGEGFIEKKRLL
jgi:hypothetical protein